MHCNDLCRSGVQPRLVVLPDWTVKLDVRFVRHDVRIISRGQEDAWQRGLTVLERGCDVKSTVILNCSEVQSWWGLDYVLRASEKRAAKYSVHCSSSFFTGTPASKTCALHIPLCVCSQANCHLYAIIEQVRSHVVRLCSCQSRKSGVVYSLNVGTDVPQKEAG